MALVSDKSFACGRTKKKVSFGSLIFDQGNSQPLGSIATCTNMTDEERNSIWYNQWELNDFRNRARTLARKHRLVKESRSAVNSALLIDPSGEDQCTRGLEHRISCWRQRNKYLAIHAVLQCQKRLVPHLPDTAHSARLLSNISSKFTRSARELALETGQSDFKSAYRISKDIGTESPSAVDNAQRYSLALKRKFCDTRWLSTEHDQQPKRRRCSLECDVIIQPVLVPLTGI